LVQVSVSFQNKVRWFPCQMTKEFEWQKVLYMELFGGKLLDWLAPKVVLTE